MIPAVVMVMAVWRPGMHVAMLMRMDMVMRMDMMVLVTVDHAPVNMLMLVQVLVVVAVFVGMSMIALHNASRVP